MTLPLHQIDAFKIRWFTPTVEVDLCGHATLASAHFLYDTGQVAPDEKVRFNSASGRLTVQRRGDGLTMRFPIDPPRPGEPPPGLVEAVVLLGQAVTVMRGELEADEVRI